MCRNNTECNREQWKKCKFLLYSIDFYPVLISIGGILKYIGRYKIVNNVANSSNKGA